MSLRRYLLRSVHPRQRVAIPPCFEQIGRRAFDLTAMLCALGPRPPGTPAHKETIGHIQRILVRAGFEVEAVRFVAETSRGPIPMTNILGRLAGADCDAVVLSGHFDTIRTDQLREAGKRLTIWRAMQTALGRRSQQPPSFTGA
ncbi:MAG: hypothetical protein KF861_11250, partial [Planctomycetaceae bacterium]|nr:hypothetical protein [Planctomycetaceae bacterium]